MYAVNYTKTKDQLENLTDDELDALIIEVSETRKNRINIKRKNLIQQVLPLLAELERSGIESLPLGGEDYEGEWFEVNIHLSDIAKRLKEYL